MPICITRFRETVTPLMRSCLWYPTAKRCVFKSRLQRSDTTAGHATNQAASSKCRTNN